MDAVTVDTILMHVRESLERNDVPEAIRIIETLLPADQADVFEELEPEHQEILLPQLAVEDAADILEELDEADAANLAARIDEDSLAQIVAEMEPDEAADLLGDLDPILSTATLELLEEADDVRPLLLHQDRTAGGLMTSEYLAFPQAMRVSQVLSAIREWEPRGPETPRIFVVNGGRRLVGQVGLMRLIRAEPAQRLRELMDPDVLRVHTSDDQEAAAHLMSRYDLLVVPVVDDEERLVGVITVDDLVEVLEDEATEDIQRIGGTEPLDRPYLDSSVGAMARKRIWWLLLLFVTGTLTGSVMSLFQEELDRVVALSLFIPLLIGTGGNAGTQTTTTIIRALSVGDISLRDTLRVLWHEFRTALILGALLTVVAYIRAITWVDSPAVALVVSASIFAIVLWANGVGSVLPLLAARFKVDPALVSGPLMSTLVDATGLLIYFSVASLVLGL
ncbi:MAG TPA: magnesium transporter [Chloroflexi bacterium]|jgi:magnesium transporter|nr:magnesium transporter [Chloroflexota bacterium]